MPQATEELRAKFPGYDAEALEVLKENFVVDKKWIIHPRAAGYTMTQREDDAIEYLFEEWDFGYDPAPVYQCIGQSRETGRCRNTSPTPSNHARPDWGFLCQQCANAKPTTKGRDSHGFSILERDDDKPNTLRETLDSQDVNAIEAAGGDVDIFA